MKLFQIDYDLFEPRLGANSNFGCCPNSVSALGRSSHVCLGSLRSSWRTGIFIHLQLVASGSRIANAKCELQIAPEDQAMLGELMHLPTDTLIDMLYIILAGEVAISASDAAEIEQIQRELQRRGGEQCWSLQIVN